MLTSQERRRREKQELRQAILDAAGGLILACGYEEFSLRRVAERIGYSATTIYLHFENKDALLAAVIDEGFGRFLLALQAVDTADPLERIADLGRAYVRFGQENCVYYQLMFMQRADLLKLEPCELPEDQTGTFAILVDAVKRALDAGALRPGDPEALSLVLWAAMHGIVALAVTMPHLDDVTIARTTELMLDALGRSMRS